MHLIQFYDFSSIFDQDLPRDILSYPLKLSQSVRPPVKSWLSKSTASPWTDLIDYGAKTVPDQ